MMTSDQGEQAKTIVDLGIDADSQLERELEPRLPQIAPHPIPQAPLSDAERQSLLDSLNLRFQPRQIRRQQRSTQLALALYRYRISVQAIVKRVLDITLSLALLLMFSPVVLVLLLEGRLRRTTKLGYLCEPYTEFSFALSSMWPGRVLRTMGVHHLPTLLNVLKGDMSIVGPRSASPDELTPRERAVRKRAEVRPGLLCLWWLRSRSNINFQSELDTDSEYVENNSLKGDLGILLRGLPTLLYGDQAAETDSDLTLLNIPINNITMGDVLEVLHERIDRNAPTRVCFVNADCANLAFRNDTYLDTLQTADLVLADGIGMKIAGKLLRQEIRQNVNGTDLFPRLCESLQGTGRGIYLLGARPGVAEGVQRWVEANYPGVVVSGCHTGYFSQEEEAGVIRGIADSGAAILLVAFGAPRQDQWIHEHLEACGVPVAMGVGGLFDFYSGQTPRAPLWVREMGFEWFYRFLQEPGRLWKRYLVGNVVFLARVFRSRLVAQKCSSTSLDAQDGPSRTSAQI